MLKEFLFFLESSEVQAWIKTNPFSDVKRTKEIIEKCKDIVLSEIAMGEEGVVTPESFFELLINESGRTKRSRLINKLRELFASEVTRKVNEIMKSLNKKK